jgi:hypothetical protein
LLGGEDLDADPVGVEDEERVVVVEVVLLLGREVDRGAECLAALEGGVDLLARVDLEGEVLDADAVVAVARRRRPGGDRGSARRA